MGRGVTAAMGRRKEALELERVWLRERKATALSLKNGFNILRGGFAKLDWTINISERRSSQP